MRRKFLSVVLCVCMMLTMVPFAWAAEQPTAITADTTTLSDGTSYILNGDVTLSQGALTIPENTTVSINLNNHKLTNKDGNHTIVNNGALTITGRGTVDNVSNGTAALYNNAGATATLNGGTYTRSKEAGKSADNSGGNSYYTLKNFGTMTINPGVTVNQGADGNGKYSSLIANGWYDGSTQGQDAKEPAVQNGGAKMTINGGTFNGGLNTIKNDDYGTLTINSGTFQNYAQHAFFNANVATINGGTFVNDGTRGVIYTYAKWNDTYGKGTLDINGGIFVNKGTSIIEKSATNATVNITGGVFSSQVDGSTEKGSLYVYPSTNPVAKIGDLAFSNVADAVYAAGTNDTITMVNNTNLFEVLQIPADKTIILDLNGYTIKAPTTKAYDAIINRGTLTIKDSKKTGEIISDYNTGIGLLANSKTTIEYAKITGREGAIGGYASTVGATLTINDGIFKGIDNAVVIFNGSNRTGDANTITINGGTFNGTIQSKGYVACGIYAPWQDNITVNGGTFNITNGAGIVARAGNVTVTDGEFNTTGNTTGRVGDSRVVVPCSALVFDSGANYPALTDSSKLTINGGKFKSDANNIAVVIPDAGDTNTRVEVTKGYFTSDPTPYCAENLTGVASDLNGYAYMVGNATTNTDKASTDSTTVKANVATNIPQGKEELVNNAAGQMTDGAAIDGKNLEAVVKSEADKNNITKTAAVNNNAVTIYNNNKTDNADKLTADNVAIVYQSYIDVTVSDVEKTGDTYSQLSLELIPMYRVVATKQDNVTSDATLVTEGDGQNAVVIQAGQPLNNVPVNNYKVKLALPSGFASKDAKLSIKHTKGNGSVEYYTGTVSTEGEEGSAKTYVTFTTNGFSPFVIYAASANVASIGDGENEQVFTSFQAAVDAVENGGTIKALKNIDSTVSGNKTFTVNAESNTVTLTAASGYNLTKNDNVYTVSRQHSGSSSSGTTTSYNVNVNAATNGTVAADKKTASKGTTVTVTASPSKGYVVDAVKVVDKDGKDVAVTEKDGKYVFTMPASAVTVTGSFKAETPAPVALPFTDVKSGNWFYDAVKYAYEQGLMTGTSATTFAPNGTMNRAMIVTVLYRLEKSPAVTGASKFTDVPAGQWYSDAVAWAAANKIVNGYDETTFGPMNAVTREQMAAILFRYEQVKGLENVTLEENLNRFPDQNKISAYAIPALQWAVGQKIINGNADGTLDPTGTATRAQVAQIFTNLLNK